MSTYSDLDIDTFYLVRLNEGAEIMLIQPLMETDKCMLLWSETDDEEITFWKEKTDEIFKVVDELDEEQAEQYASLFEDEDEDEDVEFN